MNDSNNWRAFYGFQIPNDWRLEKLGTFGETFTGLSGKTKEDFGSGKPYIPYLNIFNNAIIRDGDFDFVNIGENETQSLVQNGDLFFTTSSETPEEVGMCSVYLGNESELYLNSFCFGFRANSEDDISTEFTAQLFRSALGRRIIYKLAQGATRYNISKTNLLLEEIPLPPLPEQKAIAQVLSTADAAIHTTEKLIAQKELRKKWLMQQLLTGKKRLKGFSGEWKEYSYEKILKVVKRNFDWNENELYKLISVRRRSGGIFYREALYGHQILVKTLRTANEGDFLFSKMQILHGASALVTKEFDGAKISGSYIAVVPKDKKQLNMEFFQWYSQTPYFYHQTYISSYGVHIEKMTFDFDTFLQLEMKLPSIEEQTAIAQVLQAADKEISLLKAKAEKLREQKKGLMQQLLTGKVRLKIKNEII